MKSRGSTSQFRGHPRTSARRQLLHDPSARLGCRAFWSVARFRPSSSVCSCRLRLLMGSKVASRAWPPSSGLRRRCPGWSAPAGQLAIDGRHRPEEGTCGRAALRAVPLGKERLPHVRLADFSLILPCIAAGQEARRGAYGVLASNIRKRGPESWPEGAPAGCV